MTEVLILIALWCGNPEYITLNRAQVLDCRQKFFECYNKANRYKVHQKDDEAVKTCANLIKWEK